MGHFLSMHHILHNNNVYARYQTPVNTRNIHT
jgi:hypothetical protein